MEFFFVLGFAGLIFLLGVLMLFVRLFRKVEQGKALIVGGLGRPEPKIYFTGGFVIPIIHKPEVMDISVKTIEIDRRGKEGLICGDNIRADIKVTFFVRVNKTKEDVTKVAQSIGCQRASDRVTLEELFNAKFSEALKTVGKQLDFIDLYTKRDEFRDQIIRVIGRDLNGYVLEDAAIDFLEQTPLSSLDEDNILDAQGIRKITQLTTAEHVHTNEFQNNERKLITKQNVEADEAIFELERQRADAEAKKDREIATMRAREEAETKKVQEEERLRAETARIKTDEDVAVQEENKQRQVEVAEKNRQRVIAVEEERIEKDRQLEVIVRERETELNRIAKDKEVEVEKKAIAEVVRERVAVERTVAEEEETIKKLRRVEEAERERQAKVIAAEAEAQENLVKDIKAAEAAEQAAQHRAKERVTLAEAEVEAADREASAKIRLAEGVEAEEAAAGRAEAAVLKEKGLAEAVAIQEKFKAEAAGLTEKAEAMRQFDEASREHEEYRLRLENERVIALEDIDARRDIAEKQARVLSEALESADIDIVGGDGVFFDKLVNSIASGKSVDGFYNNSNTAQALLGDYVSGKKDLSEDLKSLLAGASQHAQGLGNLTLSALLAKMMLDDDADKEKIKALQSRAAELGLDKLRIS
ncbi:MAG TPA: SPFH domain-containing protein [Acidobacteriota bacterium]|nr:SPFH domain-containing protein [Acidobacteriota bacterium]